MRKAAISLVIQFWAAILHAQNVSLHIDSTHKEEYRKAKIEFSDFEKAHGNFIQTKNVYMHYLAWGRSSGTPLIWSHGSFTNGYELLPVANDLAAAGYYVIAIDYYGHGQTPIPDHEVSLYHVADDIEFLMNKLNIKKAVVGGWSRGGSIATAFYDAYPTRVSGLILEDGGSVSTNTYYHKMDSAELANRVNHIYNQKISDTAYSSEVEAYRALYDTSVKGSQFDNLAWIGKTKEGKWGIGTGLLKLFNMHDRKQFVDNILRPATVPLFAESMSLLEPKIIYRNLNVPILILDPVSKDDMFPFEAENKTLQKKHPQLIEHKIYENTGHNIHYERKEQFIKDVTAFLNKVKRYNKLK